MSVYSCSVKILASGFDKLLEGIFCLLVVVEMFFLQKVVEMLKEVVVGWGEVRWIWWMRQNFIALFVQLLKRWLCNVWLDIVVEKNWALSVDHCQLQALQFLVHLINLLNISSVQSLSRVWLFVTPWIAAPQASLSITNSWSSLRLTYIESVMPSSYLILCRPLFLLPQSLPASESFPLSQLFAWGGQSTGVSASASFPPKKS